MGGWALDRVDVDSHPAAHPGSVAPERSAQLTAHRDRIALGKAQGRAAHLGCPRRALDGVHRLPRAPASGRTTRDDDAEGDNVIAARELSLHRPARDVTHQLH